MKTVTMSEVQENLEAVLGSAQKERIVLTRAGKPSAVLVGIESYDDEDLQLARSEEFWRLIQRRRRGRSIPLAELRARLKVKSSSASTGKKAVTSPKPVARSRASKSSSKR